MWRRAPWLLLIVLNLLAVSFVDSSTSSLESGRVCTKRLRQSGVVATAVTAVAALAVANATHKEAPTPLEAYRAEHFKTGIIQ